MLRRRFFHLCLLGFLLTGCTSLADKEKLAKQKEEVELKRTRFTSLRQQIDKNTLMRGTPATQMEEAYGSPDSVFHSGSSESSFEIWTYEKVLLPGEEDDWQPVRLYFNNGKLESWKY
jgi:hypothetical protein